MKSFQMLIYQELILLQISHRPIILWL